MGLAFEIAFLVRCYPAVNRARTFDFRAASAAMAPGLSTFWEKPQRSTAIVLALFASFVFIGFLTLILSGRAAVLVLDHPSKHFLYPFTIQNIMHVVFFVGLGALFVRWRIAVRENNFLQAHFLPEDDRTVLMSRDLGPIRRRVANLFDHDNGFLPSLINIAILQFQSSSLVEQAAGVMSQQLELMSNRVEMRYGLVRFIAWVVPTLGFIGTVYSLGASLSSEQAEGHFTQCSFSNSQIGLVIMNGARGELHSCAFESIGMGDSSGAIMIITGANTQLTGDDCHFTNNSVGVSVGDAAALTLSNSVFNQNGASAARYASDGVVVVRDAAHAVIRNTKLIDSSPYALNIFAAGSLILENAEVSGSRTAGLVVGQEGRSPAHAEVKGSHFNGNATGIAVLGASSAEIEDSECQQNNDGILVFDQGSRLNMKKGAIAANRSYGLRVYRNGEALVVDSDIKNNGRGAQSGVPHKPAQRGSLTLQDCRIGGNQVFGLNACSQSQLILTRCVFDEDSKKNILHERGAIVQSDGGSEFASTSQDAAEESPTPEGTAKPKSTSKRTTKKRQEQDATREPISRIIQRWVPRP
jgi:hypothetical protein